jgi:hypothetical protein
VSAAGSNFGVKLQTSNKNLTFACLKKQNLTVMQAWKDYQQKE